MEPGTGGTAMVNREARRLLFRLMGRVGVGEAMNPREERGAGCRYAHHVEMGGGCGMQSFSGMKSCFEVRDGQSG